MATPTREARKQRSQQAKAIRLARACRRRQLKVLAAIATIVVIFGGTFAGISLAGRNSGTAASSSTSTSATPITAPTTTIAPVPEGASISGATPCPPTNGSATRTTKFASAPPNCIDANKTYTATFDTTQGKIVAVLDAKATPRTTNNFVVLARYKYYDGSAIVRTNTGIDIIQGGAPGTQTNADPGPGYTIDDEGKSTYVDGDLVMARTSQPNSTGAQFFFGAGPNVSQLDSQGTYIKFGHVTTGLDVLHKILGLHQATDPSQPSEGAPSTPVIVNSITISES